MNAILHIVKKDLRVVGSSVLIFAGLLVLNIIAQSPFLPEGAILTQIARNIVPMATFIVLLTCVVMVVLEDPVAGTSAFWMTRPTRGGTLLAAKVLLIGGMLAAYLLTQVSILAMAGGFHLTPYLVGGFAVTTLAFIVALTAAASMASDPKRFLVTAIIGLAVLGVLTVVGNFLGDVFRSDASLATKTRATGVASARVAAGVLALLGATGLVWHQYATRRTLRTGLLGVVGTLVIVGVFFQWKTDFFMVSPVTESREKELGLDRFLPSLKADSVGRMRSTYEDAAGGEHVRLLLNGIIDTTELAESGWKVRRVEGMVKLVTKEGRSLESTIGREVPVHTREQSPIKGFRVAGETMGDHHEEGLQIGLVDLPESEFLELGKTTVSGTVELILVVIRSEVVAELPLEGGSEVRVGAESWKLRDFRPSLALMTTAKGGVVEQKQVLHGAEINLDAWAPDLWLFDAGRGPRSQSFGDTPVVLMNRERGEWMRPGGGGGSSNSGQPGVPVARNTLMISYNANGNLDPDWLDGATLAIVDDRDSTTITRTLLIEDVVVIQE